MKIIHISDLHFGRQEENLLPVFMHTLQELAPDLVVVSGDFTQNARPAEFCKAAAFLKSLPCPFFAVPGNHDVASFDLTERLLFPFRRYRKFIDPDLCPIRSYPNTLIIGINTARRLVLHWNWANGAVGREQLRRIEQASREDAEHWKICVLHHPIHRTEDAPIPVRVFGAKRALQAIHDMKIDLVLTGHLHHASIAQLGDAAHKSIFLSASTALSSRVRAQGNGFNFVTLESDHLDIAIYGFKNGEFRPVERFERTRAF